MARTPHRRWKGCCIMCGFHTLRGLGQPYRDAFSVQRVLGAKRRYGRTETTEPLDVWYDVREDDIDDDYGA